MTPQDEKHNIKTYVLVIVALDCISVITVGISYLDLATGPAIVLALIVASIKGSLVACYFMHLIDEKVTIYWTLLATVAMFMVLMFVPLGTMLNHTQM